MPQEQIASWENTIRESVYQSALLTLIQIDEDVPTKDNVQTSKAVVVLEVVIVEYHVPLDLVADDIVPILLFEIPLNVAGIDAFQLIFPIHSTLCALESSE